MGWLRKGRGCSVYLKKEKIREMREKRERGKFCIRYKFCFCLVVFSRFRGSFSLLFICIEGEKEKSSARFFFFRQSSSFFSTAVLGGKL